MSFPSRCYVRSRRVLRVHFWYFIRFFHGEVTLLKSIPEGDIAMNKISKMFASSALIAILSAPVWAATKTVTLNVPGMTCPTCPITIKKALNKVQGVSNVDVSYEP